MRELKLSTVEPQYCNNAIQIILKYVEKHLNHAQFVFKYVFFYLKIFRLKKLKFLHKNY